MSNESFNIPITRNAQPPPLTNIKLNWKVNMCTFHFDNMSDNINNLRKVKDLHIQYRLLYNTCLCCGNIFMNTPERDATKKPRFWSYLVNDHFTCCNPHTWSV